MWIFTITRHIPSRQKPFFPAYRIHTVPCNLQQHFPWRRGLQREGPFTSENPSVIGILRVLTSVTSAKHVICNKCCTPKKSNLHNKLLQHGCCMHNILPISGMSKHFTIESTSVSVKLSFLTGRTKVPKFPQTICSCRVDMWSDISKQPAGFVFVCFVVGRLIGNLKMYIKHPKTCWNNKWES